MSEIVIDLSAVERNAEKIKNNAPLIAVVKDDAYGHGSVPIAKRLSGIACCFAVANVEEAEELAKNGISDDVLVLCPSHYPSRFKNVVYSVSSKTEIDRLSRLKRPRVAVKVNTGMNRFGVMPDKSAELFAYARERAIVHSVYSHLRDPDYEELAELQRSRFVAATEYADVPRHLVSSCGLKCGREYYFDAVRCGIALYGGCDGYEQAMSVYAPILTVRDVRAGDGVGYGTDVLDKHLRVAVIGMGYADGYRRLTLPRHVFIGGARCRVLSVCMDVCIAALPETTICDDTAEIMGKHITVGELAESYGTIAYEVFTSFGKGKRKHYG